MGVTQKDTNYVINYWNWSLKICFIKNYVKLVAFGRNERGWLNLYSFLHTWKWKMNYGSVLYVQLSTFLSVQHACFPASIAEPIWAIFGGIVPKNADPTLLMLSWNTADNCFSLSLVLKLYAEIWSNCIFKMCEGKWVTFVFVRLGLDLVRNWIWKSKNIRTFEIFILSKLTMLTWDRIEVRVAAPLLQVGASSLQLTVLQCLWHWWKTMECLSGFKK